MEAGSRKSPTENDQLGARSGSPRAVTAYLGCCCHLLLFIEPQPLGFVGEEVVLCFCALPTPPTPPLQPCFFPREGSRVSSHYRLCVWGERAAVCLHSALQCFESHPLPSYLPACLLSLSLCCRGEALARVIALWGIAPALFICLFTCLPSSASSSARLFESPCRCSAVGLVKSVLLQGFKMTLVWSSWQ